MSEPNGLKVQRNIKCPHCNQKFPIRIIIPKATMLIGVPDVDRKGAYTKPIIPGFQPRTVA